MNETRTDAALRTVFSSDLHGCQAGSAVCCIRSRFRAWKTCLATAHCWWQITPATGTRLVLATALPMDYRLRVMGKEELFQNPILAWVIRVGGAFPVNRGGADIQAVKTAIQTIQSGHNLLIFPEGTTDPKRHRQGGRPAGPRPQRRGGDRRPYRRAFWCRCLWTEKSGPSTGHASSSASPIRRYTPAAGGPPRKCRRSRMIFSREIYALGGQQVGGAPLCK